ncbi:Vps52 / Sac2 family protein [Dictyocaulus viviparus]|uniref:Vacuolar protein sorting-associated protein 52 homolog n=1 Tax=Dictyocaulus viviparus TaxID=29172 RepID=A0A0D8XR05_DICVI|nr:Vps52 / Sac2 family protein [Dictyocaulus viviparus]
MSAWKDQSGDNFKALEDCLNELATADEGAVREALSSGNNLNNFSDSIKEELTEAHRNAVRECIRNADKLTDLHNQIIACDQVFEPHALRNPATWHFSFQRLEKMLLGFQGDLGTISQDMKRLQEESVSINQELDNRQKVRGELSQFVDDIIVPENMIKIIMEADVNDRNFLEQLHELQHKINFVKAQEFKDARSVYDVLGVLESLKFKAIEKIREWILIKIYMFRKPLSNYQIPQHQLLNHRFFYQFLLGNESNIAQEVQEEYVDTVSKMFFSYFKVYIARLFKLLMTDAASKDDLLGTEQLSKSVGISVLFASKPHHRNRATVFSLGSRQEILTHDFLNPLIVPHTAQEANQKFQFEALFRSIHLAFADHCSHEFLFLTDFFMVSGQTAVDLHTKIVRRYAELTCSFLVVTESSGQEIGKKMEAILESCEDAVEQLLLRMSSCLSSSRDRLVFLINNYDLILNIIDERVVQETRIHSIIRELEQKAIGDFVETTLQPHFSPLLSFVTECEPLVQQGHTQLLIRYNDKLTSVVQSFSGGWRQSIDKINGEVVTSFTNFKIGTHILQAVFTQLVQYVQRFSKLVSHEMFRENPARNDMVNIHHILVELKKYKPVY